MPITSTHRSNAQKLMDYYYDPAVAAQVAAWVNYVCPVAGAQQAMKDIDPDLVEDPFIFPTDAQLSKAHAFMPVDEDTRRDYERKFRAVIGA